LERIAWREGRASARALERRCLRAFLDTAARTLRDTDLVAHDPESVDFLAALLTPARGDGAVATPADCRAALARLCAAVESATGLQVETGWTFLTEFGGPTDVTGLTAAVERALECGAREGTRHAYLSAIGHELRTPLTSIRGYLETIIDEELDPDTTRRFLETARSEALRMGRLLDGLFDVALFEGDPLRLGGERGNLRGAFSAALNAVAPFAAARRTIISQLACDEHEVQIDADRLTQILINILENAIKHGRDAGRVIVSVAPLNDRYLEIRVDDDGPGVALDEREPIFQLAHRGARTRTAGSGLGLGVVRLMLQRIGGEADVGESMLGGAQFRIRLPRVREGGVVSTTNAPACKPA
jgi:two-component system phosphate regulon sensor histidine kinase PhoR